MKHVLVGDGHYRGAPGERGRFRRVVDFVASEKATEFSILGDFFELWIARDGVMAAWQFELLDELDVLRERGVKLRYVVGNKDYFVPEWNRKTGVFDEVIERSARLPSAQGELHLAHGDLVNHADRQYRTWHAISRSWFASALARSLPKSWLEALGSRLSNSLEKTNRVHKIYFPENELVARAKELPEGPLIMIYGHFHQYRDFAVGAKRVITLPFLATENAGVMVDESGVRRFDA